MKRYLSTILLTGALVLTGCGDSNSNGFNFDPIPIGNAPVARSDSYTVDQGQVLNVPASGVLINDVVNGALPTFQAQSSGGGTVVGNSSGAFTYTPLPNFTGGDSFTYTLENSFGISTATVNIQVNAVAVDGYFVDAANGSDTDGDFNGGVPFSTIQAAVAAAPAGADIVVRPGSYTGQVTLKNQQRLLGSGSTLVNPQGEVRPVLSGGRIILGDGNTVDFFRVVNAPGDAIDGDDRNGGTITNCEIDTTTSLGSGVSANPGSGTWTVSNNQISNATGLGVWLTTNNSLQMTARVNNNMLTGNGFNAIGFTSENSSQLTAQVHGNTMTGNQVGATFEAFAFGTSTFCLDLEDNTNDDVYVFSEANSGAALSIEELLVGPPASVPSNTGTFQIDSGTGSSPPASVADGFCGF